MSKFKAARTFVVLTACVLLYGAILSPARADCPGDLTGDYAIDLSDLAQLLGNYGLAGDATYEDGDMDGDEDVDLDDLAWLLGLYGTPCPPPEVMVSVPGGEFAMGDSFDEGYDDELPVHTVYLSPYYIDKYEVTNQQYCDALNWMYTQGGLITITDGVVYKYGSGTSYPYCSTTTSSSYSRITWNGGTFGVTSGKENHPMVMVSWYGSVAFCNWRSAMEGRPLCYNLSTWTCNFGVAGYRLPTEAEWEKAAGWDPVQQRHYRFGEHTDGCGYNCLDSRRANYDDSGDPYESGASPQTTPVGFYNGNLHYKVDFGWPGSATSYQTQDAQSYYGCRDMSGNVYEWCYDWYSSSYYSSSPSSNPTGPGSGTYRCGRNGDWAGLRFSLRSTIRFPTGPDRCREFLGFRCAAGTP